LVSVSADGTAARRVASAGLSPQAAELADELLDDPAEEPLEVPLDDEPLDDEPLDDEPLDDEPPAAVLGPALSLPLPLSPEPDVVPELLEAAGVALLDVDRESLR
jgi:hypothetical protein